MKHTPLDNLRLIAEYVYFADAPALLGIPRWLLTRYAHGQNPNPANAAKIAAAAEKIRRREAQVKRLEREKAEREYRRVARKEEQLDRDRWRQALMAHGIELPMPQRIPRLLRVHDVGQVGSPVYIYEMNALVRAIEAYRLISEDDLHHWREEGKESKALQIVLRYFNPDREVQEYWKDEGIPDPLTDLDLFYDLLRHILPMGQAFLTYEVCPGGTTEQGGRVTKDERNLRMTDTGCYTLSTTYWQFWRDRPGGIDEVIVNSAVRFIEFFNEINDASKKRRVIEMGVTFPVITRWSVSEKARFAREGLNPVWGVKINFE